MDYPPHNLLAAPTLGKLAEADLDAAIAWKLGAGRPAAVLASGPRRPTPAVHRSSCGRRRAFLGHRDAAAYDKGFRAYPAPTEVPWGTPEWMGWADARDAAESAAAMDDTAEWANASAGICGRHLP